MKQCRGPGDKPSAKKRKAREQRIFRKYGLTPEAYQALLVKQNHLCVICQQPFEGTRRAVVDHDHKTNRVRGILCGWCNHRILSMLERGGVKRAYYAIRYLGWLPVIRRKAWKD